MERAGKQTTATEFLKQDGRQPCGYWLISPEETDISTGSGENEANLIYIARFSEGTQTANQGPSGTVEEVAKIKAMMKSS